MEFNDFTKVLRLADGTQISFLTTFDLQYFATEIKDRNGNFITIVNSPITNGDDAPTNGNVEIEHIIDTFGRRIDFYYESNLLRKIRQDRGGGAYFDYVTIDYAELTVALNFGNLIVDPAGMDKVWVPSRVDYPTGSNYRFYYTSYAQMWMIEKWVPTVNGQGDERSVAYSRYDLPTANGNSYPAHSLVNSDPNAQGDCPRFANRYEYGESWNAGSEVGYAYAFDALTRSSKITDPLGRIYETAILSDGLTHTQKIFKDEAAYTASQASKTVTTVFEQDSGLTYQSNLRMAEVRMEDADNVRKITYAYPASGIKLPIDVTEYSETNIYRHTQTDYEQGVEYTNRHIFGLPVEVRIYDGEGTATSAARTVFSYDEPAYIDTTPYQVTGHDTTGYGPGLVTGRGNLTTITQYEVNGSTSRALSHAKYDITGVVSAVYDGAGHMTEFYYEDNFTNKPVAEETHGLATRVRDGDGYWSGARYDWNTGNARETYHIPGTGGAGAPENVTTYVYSSDDRLKEVQQPTGGLYERVYWDNWMALAEYTRIDPGALRYEYSAFEGTGQLRWTGGDHPDGVIGKFSIQKYTHDTAGRTSEISNTAAVDGNQVPIDDDVAGFEFTRMVYDELDRQSRITRPDLSTVSYDYTGCGCAGKSTVTITDERGKKRRMVRDFLERLQEAHDLDSVSSTYSKAIYYYDVRDLMTKIEHSDSTTRHQDRTLVYDGYGRMVKETTPEGGTLDFGYYGNDLIESIVHNERGTSAIYRYNNRNLVTDIDYNDATPDVHYEYGEYGERTAMQEKDTGGAVVSTTNYGYDAYKRLASETRSFWGFAGTYTVAYDYNYIGVTRITVSLVNSFFPSGWTRRVNYAYNFAGSVSSVGTDLIGVSVDDKTNVANTLVYRGFGGLKSLRYGTNPRRLQIGYDIKRQQMASLLVDLPDGTDAIINRAYDYLNGGGNNSRIQRITNAIESDYTTTCDYDEYNRLTSATCAAWSRQYNYDPWGNLTKVVAVGGTGGSYDLSYAPNASGAPATNQIANPGFSYDAAGNQTNNGWQVMTYDAANRLRTALGGETLNDYDGDGRRAKHLQWGDPIYYLWSSVLGEPVLEIHPLGKVYRAYVYWPGGGQVLALQTFDEEFYWVHTDHLGTAVRLTDVTGAECYKGELDPHGQPVSEWAIADQTFLTSHKFTGYERDWATLLDYAKARTYQSERGRFLQLDPLGLGAADPTSPQSLNRYSYVHNDPITFSDPNGLFLNPSQPVQPVVPFWGGDVSEEVRPEILPQNPAPTATPTPAPQKPIYCQPDVIKAMERAWRRTGNGTAGTEAGFVLNGTPSKYTIVDTKSGSTQGYEKMTVNLPGNPAGATFALFHVHPGNSGPYPSTPGNNKLGNNQGDTGVADQYGILFYVISSRGLAVYDPAMKNDPKTKGIIMLRQNLDWTKAQGCK